MNSSPFNKQELAAAFDALSQQRKMLLEVMLLNPKSLKAEGRGFFNDVDFLCDAVSPQLGRFNFALSPFAYASDQSPSRSSYNQFDRALSDAAVQEKGRPHSLTLWFQFKPEVLREMAAASDPQQGVMQIAYEVSGVLNRMHLNTFALEFNPMAFTVRFMPKLLQTQEIRKPQFLKWTQSLLERVNKEMTPSEHKRFALGAAVLGQGQDPVPGLPGLFGDDKDLVTVWSLSPPRFTEEPFFADLLEESLTGKKSAKMDVYAPSNLQGLSQSWDDGEGGDENAMPETGSVRAQPADRHEPESGASSGFADRKQKEEVDQLGAFLKTATAATWTWPLYSQAFTRLYRGLQCGQVLLLQADPFSGSLAFDFLMQSAEPLAKEGKGQILIFTKKKSSGDLALGTLARHHHSHPLAQNTSQTSPADWAKSYASMFANPPFIPVCAPHEGLENLLNYIDHDFLLRQKRKGGTPLPLVILLDNLEEFQAESAEATYRGLLKLRQRLRDLNATLWLTQLIPSTRAEEARTVLGLADFHAVLDCDGRFEKLAGSFAADPGAWEKSFTLDANLQKALPDLALVRIGFAAQGSHRRYPSPYLYHRPTCMYKEVGAPT